MLGGETVKHKKALSAFLAMLVIFQAACPLSAVAQDASAESQVAAAKRKGKAKRVFSTRSSVEPSTPEAAALAESLAKSLPSRLTSDTLRKFKLKPGKSALSVSGESKFSITDLAEDRTSWARGYASVSGGDAFALFLTGPNRVVGIVETYQRTVGNKKIDLERETQLRAAGFKVNLLVDRFQVVLWDSLDPEGIPATVAKPPTFVTAPLTPEQVQKIFFPKKRQSSGMSASADAAVSVGLAGAVGALGAPPANGAPGRRRPLKVFNIPTRDCECVYEAPAGLICEHLGPDGYEIKCEYGAPSHSTSLGGGKGLFPSAGDCLGFLQRQCEANCRGQKGSASKPSIRCEYPAVAPIDGLQLIERTLNCPDVPAKARLLGGESCKPSGSISCHSRNLPVKSAKLLPGGNKVRCECGLLTQDGPYCPGTNIGCEYPQVEIATTMDFRGEYLNTPQAACDYFCATKWQEPSAKLIECPPQE